MATATLVITAVATIKRAHHVYVEVHGTDDTYYAPISKKAARALVVEADGQLEATTVDGDHDACYIGARR